MMRFITIISLFLTFSAQAGQLGFQVNLPPGFSIDIYAEDLPGVRSMALGEKGTVFAGSRAAGKVYAVRDTDGDGRADISRVIAYGLDSPNGTAFRDGSLYVAEIGRVIRFDGVENSLDDPSGYDVVFDYLPEDRWHGWKYIAFGPDDRLYIPVGAPCNVCEKGVPYAALHSIKYDGTDFRTEASGIRNTVGFDWNPETGSLWFTDNGRDRMGDNAPPDELNRLTERGGHFGYPFFHGGDISDPAHGEGKNESDYIRPEVKLPAHVAPLGMKFYTGEMFPEKYRGGIFIAEHGSWNRSSKVGYRVTFVSVDDDRASGYENFASGWLAEDTVHGRPVDILLLPDGSLLVSDDKSGKIYRISYGE